MAGDSLAELNEYIQHKYKDAAADDSQPRQPPQKGLRFWLDAGDTDADSATDEPDDGAVTSWTDKIAKIQITQNKPELQPRRSKLGPSAAAAVRFDGDLLSGPIADAAAAKFLNNERGSIVVVYSATHSHEGYGFEVGGDGAFVSTFIYPGAEKGGSDPIDQLINSEDPRITEAERHRYRYLSTRKKFTKQNLKRLRPVAMSLRHSFGPPYEPGVPVSTVMIRGEYDAPGDVVEPGFLSVITGSIDPAPIRLDPFKRWPTRSRRMTLAKWIASPDNPMTARVMVNRLWNWHFGSGIVRTPSDFGDLSGGASHEKLLDWMAEKFVKEKWSIKAMHRLICNSATYRQSSARDDAQANKIDPDNRLLWRFNRRRLEAEAVRDNVLAVSGRLNPEQYGLPIFPPLPGDVAETVKYSESKWDTQYGVEGRKRSIYIYQQRTLTMPLMQTFDSLVCDESRPRREASVTSLQALAMYNSQFVNEEAVHFAARVRDLAGNDVDKQINVAFALALGREPLRDEHEQMESLIQPAQEEDWLIRLCRVLYNTSEFLYID